MVRTEIKKAVFKAVTEKFGNILMPEFLVEAPENSSHGDYSTNIALLLAKILNKNPLEIAGIIKENVGGGMWKVETASPGFINFRLSEEMLESEFKEIFK